MFLAPDGKTVGLSLIDGGGNPCGWKQAGANRKKQAGGISMSLAEAEKFTSEYQRLSDPWRQSLLWAKLGYGTKIRGCVASAMCHPGGRAFG